MKQLASKFSLNMLLLAALLAFGTVVAVGCGDDSSTDSATDAGTGGGGSKPDGGPGTGGKPGGGGGTGGTKPVTGGTGGGAGGTGGAPTCDDDAGCNDAG